MNGRALRLRACAKINWTLEVIGRRDDGYHELRTILQTVALWDDVELRENDPSALSISAPAAWDLGPATENLAARARAAYAPPQPVALGLVKRVPPAAGLGGGSADAAAVLRGLDSLAPTARGADALAPLAAGLGSDVPFFLRGGCQVASGRGETLEPLPDLPPTWLVLVTPPLAVGRKTARLFGLLTPADFATGERTRALADRLCGRGGIAPTQLYNSFDRVAGRAFPGLLPFREALTRRCGETWLCGAGPALFALATDEDAARLAADDLCAAGLPAQAVRTLSAEESTAIVTLEA